MLDFLLPSPCLICNKNGSPLCQLCLATIDLKPNRTTLNKLPVWYLSKYNENMAKLISAIKERGQTALISRLLNFEITDSEFLSALLVPIPSTRKSEIRRGFSHTELIAKKLASGKPSLRVAKLLRSKTERVDQAGLSIAERQENLRDAFCVSSGKHVGKPVVLIDDVYTTGATVSAARDCLEAAGFLVLGCFVLALVDAPRQAI